MKLSTPVASDCEAAMPRIDKDMSGGAEVRHVKNGWDGSVQEFQEIWEQSGLDRGEEAFCGRLEEARTLVRAAAQRNYAHYTQFVRV